MGMYRGQKCKQTAREEFILTMADTKTNMDVNMVNVVRIEDNNNLKVLHRLKEQFPDKNLDPAGMKAIDFLSWKLVDLKKFLMITGGYKGLSKAKKERVCETVTKTWKDLSLTYYNDTDVASVRDEELMSLPSSPSSMVSPVSFPTSPNPEFMFSSASSPPLSPAAIPLQRYPITTDNMMEDDFKLWTMHQLQEYLATDP